MFHSKKPNVQQRTQQVPVRRAPAPAARPAQSNGHATARRGPPENRYQLSSAAKTKSQSAHALPSRARQSSTVSRVGKRKPETYTPLSSDEDDSDDGDDNSSTDGRKRQKVSSSIEPMASSRNLEPDHSRRIRIPTPELTATSQTNGTAPEKQDNGATQGKAGKKGKLIHGRAMCRGEWAKEFSPAFPGADPAPVILLQYPSSSKPERFELVVPKDSSNFNPLDDIYFTIEEIVQHYFPNELASKLSSEADGTVRLLKRAVFKNSPKDFTSTIEQFNKTIQENLDNGVIAQILDSKHSIALSLVRRILDQVYWRTVSPHAHHLRKINLSKKETTYGELLPSFVHTIFQQTGLNSRSVFVDLGSGVGNVVLQSALQTGAESHGIEIMDRAAEYANDQASELRARAKLWNINLGSINLLHGDFLESPEIDEVLRRADVVLVNNKVFPQKLNETLLTKFLDLKNGCKVISLASFGGGGSKHGARNENSIASLFDEERYDSGTGSVSWAGESVEYFRMTKVR